MTTTRPHRSHLHPVPKVEGYCPMCGRRLRLGTYCGHEGYHTNPARTFISRWRLTPVKNKVADYTEPCIDVRRMFC